MQTRWFQPASDETPNTNEWHAFHDDNPAAVCGEAQLSFNRDAIADEVPSSGSAHLGCREALDGETGRTYTPFEGDVETAAEPEVQADETPQDAAPADEAPAEQPTDETPQDAPAEPPAETPAEQPATETPQDVPAEEAPAEQPAEGEQPQQ